jgi:hypothetical protein
MNLSDIKKHMVDLRRSSFDKERSTPKDGKYFWNNKVYLQSKDYKDDQTRPDFVYRWVAFDEKDDFVNFNHWKMKYGAVAVDYKDPMNEVYPEPLTPSVEGYYRYMDMILMRIPLEVMVDDKIANMKQYDKAREGLDRKFKSEAAAEGAEVETVRL